MEKITKNYIAYERDSIYSSVESRLEIRTLAPIGPSIEYAKTKLDRRVENCYPSIPCGRCRVFNMLLRVCYGAT